MGLDIEQGFTKDLTKFYTDNQPNVNSLIINANILAKETADKRGPVIILKVSWHPPNSLVLEKNVRRRGKK